MSTVLVFGANGFVGSYLTHEFACHGYHVVASGRTAYARKKLEYDSYVACDLLDATKVMHSIEQFNPDVIINLAAISSVGQSWKAPQATIQVNVVGTINILEALRSLSSSSKVLLVGSSEEYASSEFPLNENSPLVAGNPYGISKAVQERFAKVYAEHFGIKIYHVRAFNHTGIGQADSFVLPSFCKQVAEIEKLGKPGSIKVGNLSVIRDFSDVRDIVRAYRLLVESNYSDEVFNIGSGVAHSLDDLLRSIISNSKQEVNVEVDPKRLRPADNPVICCDHSKATKLLGWKPEYLIEETLLGMFQSSLYD